ncbi:MAG: alpha/beta hydrolase [Zavarzinia sp.]|nr:alpha/beta hydrolase [Zavarzinia sp.]
MSDTARRLTSPPGGTFGGFTRAGAHLRTACFVPAVPARGTIVLLTGRNEFIEKYFETIADLLDRGFHVHAMDWRGQGLSDRPLPDRMKGHVRDFIDYIDDLEAFVDIVAAQAPAPLIVMAHSMGGHITARALAERPALRRKLAGAVLCSAMMAIETGGISPRTAARIARVLVFAGLGRRAVAAPKEKGAGFSALTSDPERAQDQDHFVAADPRLALGAPTFGWLDAAFRSMAVLAGPGVAEAIDLPVLVAIAGADKVVKPDAERAFAARLPRATLVEIAESRHEVLKEREALRGLFWRALDTWAEAIIT